MFSKVTACDFQPQCSFTNLLHMSVHDHFLSDGLPVPLKFPLILKRKF